MSDFLPGTYVACCRKCGGFTRWCTHDAPREAIERFYSESKKDDATVVSLRFGDNPVRQCLCPDVVVI